MCTSTTPDDTKAHSKCSAAADHLTVEEERKTVEEGEFLSIYVGFDLKVAVKHQQKLTIPIFFPFSAGETQTHITGSSMFCVSRHEFHKKKMRGDHFSTSCSSFGVFSFEMR
jgi:hypothetical protein